MRTLTRPALLIAFLTLPAAAEQPLQVPEEAESREAYYNCLLAYLADKTGWDATPAELIEAAESTCDLEYDRLLLAILKSRSEILKSADNPISMAKDVREKFVDETRADMKRIIFEARHRPTVQ